MINIILIILSLVILSSYIGVMVSREGIPSSVSATYYSLRHKFWFGFSMITSSMLLIPSMMNLTPESYQFNAFLACAGMIMVGVSPNFRSEFERPIHTIGAIMVLLFSQIWVLLINPVFLTPWVAYVISSIVMIEKNWNGSFMSSYDKTNPLFWIEIVSLLCTYSCLLFISI